MAEVVVFRNNGRTCYCQIRYRSGERVLVSIAKSGIAIYELGLGGLIPKRTLWQCDVQSIADAVTLFAAAETPAQHPLEAMRDQLLKFESIKALCEYLNRGALSRASAGSSFVPITEGPAAGSWLKHATPMLSGSMAKALDKPNFMGVHLHLWPKSPDKVRWCKLFLMQEGFRSKKNRTVTTDFSARIEQGKVIIDARGSEPKKARSYQAPLLAFEFSQEEWGPFNESVLSQSIDAFAEDKCNGNRALYHHLNRKPLIIPLTAHYLVESDRSPTNSIATAARIELPYQTATSQLRERIEEEVHRVALSRGQVFLKFCEVTVDWFDPEAPRFKSSSTLAPPRPVQAEHGSA